MKSTFDFDEIDPITVLLSRNEEEMKKETFRESLKKAENDSQASL